MNNKAEKLLEKVAKYRDRSFIIMSIIVAYHIVTPKSIGGVTIMIVLIFPIYIYSYRILEKVMWIK